MKRRPAKIQVFAQEQRRWRRDYTASVAGTDERLNRSGIRVKALYTPGDWDSGRYMEDLGFPGRLPATRGIYPSMHRGRPWSQRQLIGLATPGIYNKRLRELLAAGVTALSMIPCNSVYRGFDVDEVDRELLGTCGTTINTVEDMAACLRSIPLDRVSIGLNDPLPFTLLALLLAHARRQGVSWNAVRGTSNQSDYISHFVANHMFFRIALPGSRRVFVDHVAFAGRHLPGWNPVSIVGQHMQQAGATPAEAMAFTLSSAVQYADDCLARGLDPDEFLPRFTFFFDVSISLFEEIAKLRAGRRIWARLARARLGAKDPRSWRFKFHAQTSGVDLTRQQPLNNIARVTVQAIAGILGGLQSLHTDAFDEVLSTPTVEAARIAVSTQNILREEARLTDVIDPLGGSYYVETLTNQMEEKILSVMAEVEAAGGMFAAIESGLVQRKIGESAVAFQSRVDSGEQIIVGVNAYQANESGRERAPLERPDASVIAAQIDRLRTFKRDRSRAAAGKALDRLTRAAESPRENVFAEVVDAADAGMTHGEICACLRRVLGDGQPLIAV
ncbi:MAG: acyl-CoA mutase large subunit family protein [Rhodospirillales bacterium]|nr:acyl-CoA mutase large subunit family protein [Rhodospirillales bacterium]